MSTDGALVIDKPAGPSSHAVVARVRRALRVERVGHTGTLDPLATGVLPLLVGQATRLARFLGSGEKAYEARIRLGTATDTYDAAGETVAPDASTSGGGPFPDASAVALALDGFRGTIRQTPPAFSAKRIAGVRAYDLARRKAPVSPAPVTVTVHSLELVSLDGSAVDVRLVCSPGFYVRSLAHELGVRLGCGAHLERLRRIRSGPFGIDQAVTLDTVEAEGRAAAARITPLEALLADVPAVILNERGARRAAHGNVLMETDLSGPVPDQPLARLFSRQGALLAIAERRAGRALHPVVVLK